MTTNQPDRNTLIAFFLAVLLGGSNSVAIRFSNHELPPFWGASLRFIAAGVIFWLVFFVRKLSLPQKRDTIVLLLNGFISVGASFAFLYWGLQKVQANLGTMILALGPLFTFFLAFFHRLESFRWQALVGGLIAFVGMAIAVNAQLGWDVPMTSLLAIAAGAVLSAEGNIILKIYAPKSDPVSMNALSISSGAVFLALASIVAGETWRLPTTASTWLALTYLVLGGSVLMFFFLRICAFTLDSVRCLLHHFVVPNCCHSRGRFAGGRNGYAVVYRWRLDCDCRRVGGSVFAKLKKPLTHF